MNQARHNPYSSPSEPAHAWASMFSAEKLKKLRRYARGFWLSVATIFGCFSVALSAPIFDPRLELGQALLALAFFPYYLPIMGGTISAIIFGGFWVTTRCSPDQVHGVIEAQVQPERPTPPKVSRPLTFRRRALIGTVLFAFIGFLVLRPLLLGMLARLPLLLLCCLLLVIALLAAMFTRRAN